MDLPCTENGNKHVVILQDMFTRWPMVYAIPDQKTERITKLSVFPRPYCLIGEPTFSLTSCWGSVSHLGLPS